MKGVKNYSINTAVKCSCSHLRVVCNKWMQWFLNSEENGKLLSHITLQTTWVWINLVMLMVEKGLELVLKAVLR